MAVLTDPRNGNAVSVSDSAVEELLRRGFTQADAPKKATSKKATAKKSSSSK